MATLFVSCWYAGDYLGTLPRFEIVACLFLLSSSPTLCQAAVPSVVSSSWAAQGVASFAAQRTGKTGDVGTRIPRRDD
eukprot:5832085-Pyramimonas_sp.AAC.1